MVIRIRATFPQSKVFYKVYAVKAEMTLFSFNSFIINDLGFSPDQMVLYEGYDETGKCSSEYGLFDLGDGSMDTVTFSKLVEKGETRLHYVFDMRNDRYILLTVEGEDDSVPERVCPRLMDEKGHAPEQFSVAYEDYEAVQASGVPHPVPADDEDLEDDEEDDEDDDETEEIFDGDETGIDS